METSVGMLKGNHYYPIHQVSRPGLLPQTMKAGADRSAAEAGETKLFNPGSISPDIITEHAREATRGRSGPTTLPLGGDSQAAS